MATVEKDRAARALFNAGRSPLGNVLNKNNFTDSDHNFGRSRLILMLIGIFILSGLMFVVALGSYWPVVVGPFILIMLGMALGLQSLWK